MKRRRVSFGFWKMLEAFCQCVSFYGREKETGGENISYSVNEI